VRPVTWFRVVLGDPLLEVDPVAHAVRRFRDRYGRPAPGGVVMLTGHESTGDLHCVAVAYLSPAAAALARELGGRPCDPPTAPDLTRHD
jgi:hypothetical protein